LTVICFMMYCWKHRLWLYIIAQLSVYIYFILYLCLHTYHSRLNFEGLVDTSQIFLRDTYILPNWLCYAKQFKVVFNLLTVMVSLDTYIYTYHLRFIPGGVAETLQMFLRDVLQIWQLKQILQMWQVVSPSPSDHSPSQVWMLIIFSHLLRMEERERCFSFVPGHHTRLVSCIIWNSFIHLPRFCSQCLLAFRTVTNRIESMLPKIVISIIASSENGSPTFVFTRISYSIILHYIPRH
jgi:hypothetical protein